MQRQSQRSVRRTAVRSTRKTWVDCSQARLPINRIPLEMDIIQYSTVGGNLDRPAGGVQSWSLIQSCLCGLARIALLGNIEIRSSSVGCSQMSSRDGPGLVDAESCLSRCFVSWLQWWVVCGCGHWCRCRWWVSRSTSPGLLTSISIYDGLSGRLTDTRFQIPARTDGSVQPQDERWREQVPQMCTGGSGDVVDALQMQ
jgi:hypothetical protein